MSEEIEAHHGKQQSRGYAVIICNCDFRLINKYRKRHPDQPDPTRHGAGIDDLNLHYIFGTKLNFQFLENKTFMNVNKRHDKTHAEQPFWIHDTQPVDKKDCKCMSCKIQTIDHSNAECFVLAISTHGVQVDGKQEICFSDDLFGYISRVKLSDIIETLNDDNCKTLVGKPRIIILSMCRSDPDVTEDKQDEVWHDAGHNIGEIKDEKVKQDKVWHDTGHNIGETGDEKVKQDKVWHDTGHNIGETGDEKVKQDKVWHDTGHNIGEIGDEKVKQDKVWHDTGHNIGETGDGEVKQDKVWHDAGHNIGETGDEKVKQDKVWHDAGHNIGETGDEKVKQDKVWHDTCHNIGETGDEKVKQDKVWHDAGHNIGEIKDEKVMQQFEDLGIQCGSGDLPYQEGQNKNPDDFHEVHPSKDCRQENTSKNKILKPGSEAPDNEYYYGTEEALMNLPSNFLIVFSSVAGKKTFHNKTYGSWLIDELAESVEDFDFSRSPNMNFLSVLTDTAGRVARNKESEKGKKTAVCIVHRLLEPIIFKADLDKDGNKPSVVEDKPAL